MPNTAISIEHFEELVRPLIGLTVSAPWKGYGSTIFLELGELGHQLGRSGRSSTGQACISIDGDWRVEANSAIRFGSADSGPIIDSGISTLKHSAITEMALFGDVSELQIQLSTGFTLRSMAMAAGDPQWSVGLSQDRWLFPRNGRLHVGPGDGPEVTDVEHSIFASAKDAAGRWGVPTAEPKAGLCADCKWFVRIDGDGHLLEYGVCIANGGPFDGKAVHLKSGCPVFSAAAWV